MLQSVCHYCHQLRLSSVVVRLFAAKFELIHAGLLVDAASIDDIIGVKPRKRDDNEEVDEEEITEMDQKNAIIAKIDEFVTESLEKTDNVTKVGFNFYFRIL